MYFPSMSQNTGLFWMANCVCCLFRLVGFRLFRLFLSLLLPNEATRFMPCLHNCFVAESHAMKSFNQMILLYPFWFLDGGIFQHLWSSKLQVMWIIANMIWVAPCLKCRIMELLTKMPNLLWTVGKQRLGDFELSESLIYIVLYKAFFQCLLNQVGHKDWFSSHFISKWTWMVWHKLVLCKAILFVSPQTRLILIGTNDIPF